MIHGLAILRYALIAQTALAGALCLQGMWVAWLDIQAAQTHNGARKIASHMRFRVEALLFLVFVVLFLLAVFLLTPPADLARVPSLSWRALRSRLAFTTVVELLLAVKVVMHLGRKKLDDYYDQMEAERQEHGEFRLASAAQQIAADAQCVATDAQRLATDAQADARSALDPEKRE